MRLVEDITREELDEIAQTIGEAFLMNNLFFEFGTKMESRKLILEYMRVYVKFVYRIGALYQNEEGNAFIGLLHSDKKYIWKKLTMMWRIFKIIPSDIRKRFFKFIKEIKNDNKTYTKKQYLEVLLVCVDTKYQGKGKARELLEFAKQIAVANNVPILLDTDMKEYADIYQHYGCQLYRKKKASNGITRYNLVWEVVS